MATSTPRQLDPDRLLPADPRTRSIARSLYESVQALPIISPHGHVPAHWLADDTPFTDPTSLLITPDHYVTRMLVSQGVPLEDLGVRRLDGAPVETDPRAIWRRFCEGWNLFRGTPSRFWLEHELVHVFGVDEQPSVESADRIYDAIAARMAGPASSASAAGGNAPVTASTKSPDTSCGASSA